MKIGYYVQGDTDEAVVWGLAKRWCPDAELAEGRFRGASKESFRREIANAQCQFQYLFLLFSLILQHWSMHNSIFHDSLSKAKLYEKLRKGLTNLLG